MKKINLFFDMEFTSLSPDAQIVSIGIVSEDFLPINLKLTHYTDENGVVGEISKIEDSPMYDGKYHKIFKDEFSKSNSFYAEFTDFDINRCDGWVKENVVGKLKYKDYDKFLPEYGVNVMSGKGNTSLIKLWLYRYLEQFYNYQIQFVCDCGTFDWYHLLQLLAEWDEVPMQLMIDTSIIPIDVTIEEFIDEWKRSGPIVVSKMPDPKVFNIGGRIGLPKLPSNISPVPQDLNDLIAIKRGISVWEAFDLNRETLSVGNDSVLMVNNKNAETLDSLNPNAELKHNSLWDAKVIKAIYEKLQ